MKTRIKLFLKQQSKEKNRWLKNCWLAQQLAKYLDRLNLRERSLPSWMGAVVTSTIALGIELCRQGDIFFPMPFLLMLMAVSMSANLGGIIAGLWSHLVWSLFVIYATFIGFGPQTLTGGIFPATTGILLVGIFTVIQGWTKEENRRLTSTLTALNFDLERKIFRRTEDLQGINASLKQEIAERVVSQKALLASEKRFRAIYEQAAVGIAIAGLDKKFIEVNPKYCQITGYSAEELKNLDFEVITHPEDRLEDTRRAQEMRKNQLNTFSREKRYIRKDGSVIWVKLTATLVQDARQQPEYFMAVIEDINERKLAEIALQESENRFLTLLDACPFLVWTSDTNGQCNFFNTAWLKFTGKTIGQELGMGWMAGVHPEDLNYCLQTYKTAFAQKERFRIEYRLQKGNGEYGWIIDEGMPKWRTDGNFAGFIGTCVDISDRIQAKLERENLLQQIEQERQFLESILQQMPAGVVIAEAPLGKIIMHNQQATSILERQEISPKISDENYGRVESWQINSQNKEPQDFAMVKALRGEATSSLEVEIINGEGIKRTLLANAAPIWNKESQLIAAISTFYDITELKQAQAAKKEAENKSILLKEIHHRIKNNLQVVSALLDLQTEQIQNKAANTLLEKSQARIHTMALIHEKLYTSQNLNRVDFLEYVTSLTRYLHDSFIGDFKAIEISLEIEPIDLSLDLATPCGLIVNELVTNSLQHGFNHKSRGEIKIIFYRDACDYYHLIVKDNGSGIPPEIELKNTTHFLGLSLVESLVEKQLQGTWKIQRNSGSVIQITFSHNG